MPTARFALALLLASCALPAFAQSPVPAQTVTDINASGAKPFASLAGTEMEYVDVNNGGLNVKIPLVAKKGRGLDFNLNIKYSSKFWNPANTPNGVAWNLEGDGTSGNSVGWDAAFLNLTSGYANMVCYDPNNPDNYELSFVFHDADGAKHAFQNQTPTSCASGYPRDYSVDLASMMLKTTSYVGNPTPHTLYLPNGTRYKFKPIIGQPAAFFYSHGLPHRKPQK